MDKVAVAICEDMGLAEDAKRILGENGIEAKIRIEAKIGRGKASIYVFVLEEDYGQAYSLLIVDSGSFFNWD